MPERRAPFLERYIVRSRGPGQRALRFARKISVFVIGLSVVLFGVVLTVTPGPAILVIPLGLGILATEFLWARRLLRNIRKIVQDTLHPSA